MSLSAEQQRLRRRLRYKRSTSPQRYLGLSDGPFLDMSGHVPTQNHRPRPFVGATRWVALIEDYHCREVIPRHRGKSVYSPLPNLSPTTGAGHLKAFCSPLLRRGAGGEVENQTPDFRNYPCGDVVVG